MNNAWYNKVYRGIMGEVLDERERQISLGYDLVHDDKHPPHYFAGLVVPRCQEIEADLPDNFNTDHELYRQHDRSLYIQIAALAVAAVERIDREEAS